jgi:hypothetical protein
MAARAPSRAGAGRIRPQLKLSRDVVPANTAFPDGLRSCLYILAFKGHFCALFDDAAKSFLGYCYVLDLNRNIVWPRANIESLGRKSPIAAP